jgi:hypothetical protein
VQRLLPIVFLLFAAQAAPSADLAQESMQHGDLDITVSLDAAEQNGSARASVRIHAPREVVWSLITSCAEELKLVPGLVGCEVLETAPDRSWQRIRHVMNYSWYAPRLTFEVRAAYAQPSRVAIERTSGDLRILRGSWELQSGRGRHDRALRGRPGTWLLGSALDRARGLAARPAENVACAAYSC